MNLYWVKDIQLEKQSPKVCPVNTADMQLRRKANISEVSVEVGYVYRSQRDQGELSTYYQLSNIICLFEMLQSFLMEWVRMVLCLNGFANTLVLADSMLSFSYDPGIMWIVPFSWSA